MANTVAATTAATTARRKETEGIKRTPKLTPAQSGDDCVPSEFDANPGDPARLGVSAQCLEGTEPSIEFIASRTAPRS
jgi:hypothetical protein